MVSNFLKVGLFSILLGLAVGSIVTYIMKVSKSLTQTPMYETFFVIMGAYLSYALAHLPFFQLSGDVAIFFYGMIMSHYNKYNMSNESFRNVGLTFNLMMQAAEAICFIYIGISLKDALINHYENLAYAGIIFGSFLLCRTIAIVAIGVAKRNNKKFRVFGGEWVAILFAGMIKGPMTYISMEVLVPDRNPCLDVTNEVEYKKAFPQFVMQIYVVASILILHPLNFIIFKLAVKEKLNEGHDIEKKQKREVEVREKLLGNDWHFDHNRPRVFRYVDEFLLKPTLIRDYRNRKVYLS